MRQANYKSRIIQFIMKNKLERVSDFVSSLEREELSEDQQAILLGGNNVIIISDHH